MRVLVLTQWYPPEPQKLLSDLAESLQALGHDVQVLTGFPNYPSGRIYPGYRLRLWQRELLNGISVTRVPLYPDHSRSAFRRVANSLSFAFSATVLGPWLMRRPDAIFVLHPPLTVALPAWIMGRFWRVPFVFNIQDIWPETLQAAGMLNTRFMLDIVHRIANWAYRVSAAIIVLSPGFRKNLIHKGVPCAKVYVVSNWVDVDHYRPTEKDPRQAEQLGLSGFFNVLFAGVIGRVQGLDTVIDAASVLQDLPDIRFILVGDGIDLHDLKVRASGLGLNNVLFLGRYPEDAMPGLFALANVLLVHLRDDPLFRITIPHKIFAYMASGKPVLAAVTGDAADVVTSACAGLVCPPDNPEALAATVRRFYLMAQQQRTEMGQNGRRAACELYSRQHLVKEVSRILELAVAKASSYKQRTNEQRYSA